MKLFVYDYRDFDEAAYYTNTAKQYGVELGIWEAPTLENAHLAEGSDAVSIITCKGGCSAGGALSRARRQNDFHPHHRLRSH